MDLSGTPLAVLAQKAADVVIPEAMRTFMEKRRRIAFDILMEELRTAKVDPAEAASRDEIAAMLVKFHQAMVQGAAFRNLRVLAKLIAGELDTPSDGSDDFIAWADAIGGMLPEEIVFLATLIRHYQAQLSAAKPDEAPNLNEAIKNSRNELRGKGKLFEDTAAYDSVGSALLRTGFIIPVSAWGGIAYAPSKRAMKLAHLVRMDDWANEAMQVVT